MNVPLSELLCLESKKRREREYKGLKNEKKERKKCETEVRCVGCIGVRGVLEGARGRMERTMKDSLGDRVEMRDGWLEIFI